MSAEADSALSSEPRSGLDSIVGQVEIIGHGGERQPELTVAYSGSLRRLPPASRTSSASFKMAARADWRADKTFGLFSGSGLWRALLTASRSSATRARTAFSASRMPDVAKT